MLDLLVVGNNLRDEGAVAIAESLKMNATLKILRLKGEQRSEEGADSQGVR